MGRIKLNGTVMSNDDAKLYRWFGFQDVCCPDDVQRAFESAQEGEDVTIEINSGGGSVYAGFEMYNIIRNSVKKTRAEVFSIAGSAASVIMSGCDEVLMSPVSNVMIHRSAIGRTGGNSEQLKQNAQMLDSVDESMLNAYVEKSNGKASRTQFRHLMENETFMTAQDAINCGLADGILEKPNADNGPDPMSAVASIDTKHEKVLPGMMLNMRLPPVDDLRQIYEERTKLNHSQAESEGVQNTTDAVKEEREETMEYQNKEQLMADFPELTGQIQADAQAQERERIIGIDSVAMPGFEEIIANAKKDPKQNAGSVAMAIIAEQKKQGGKYMVGVKDDAKMSGANSVTAAEKPDGTEKDNPEAEAAEAAKAAVKAWKEANN